VVFVIIVVYGCILVLYGIAVSDWLRPGWTKRFGRKLMGGSGSLSQVAVLNQRLANLEQGIQNNMNMNMAMGGIGGLAGAAGIAGNGAQGISPQSLATSINTGRLIAQAPPVGSLEYTRYWQEQWRQQDARLLARQEQYRQLMEQDAARQKAYLAKAAASEEKPLPIAEAAKPPVRKFRVIPE
jgi:hypothetical protein